MKIFLDDLRNFEEALKNGYTCVRSYNECVELLLSNEIDSISLDYDLDADETGLDVLKYMNEKKVTPKEIIVHSTHAGGVREMIDYIE